MATELPERFRLRRTVVGDPLADMPKLDPNPKPFVPTGRYTAERRSQVRADHEDFLWPAELDLIDDLMCKFNDAFAWDDSEKGRFRRDMFEPVKIPVVEHKPWVERNIPIPPGIYSEVCEAIQRKIESGVYEPSNSSYRSRWFCVLKKDGKSLRLVHSLEPLNRVTIQHSGVPPVPEHLAEQFAGRACGATLDLFVGYDERELAEESRDLTTFQTPFGAHRLTTLPMGWSNSVPIFHDDVTFILKDEIPHVTAPYIDDVAVKGPESDYRRPDGSYETIPENSGIRRFVWEHLNNVARIIQRMRHAGGTFSGKKLILCAAEFFFVGHRCTPEGRKPDEKRVEAISNWGPCRDLSEVRAFLGTIGVARIFIKDFAKRANPLVRLTRKDVPFEFGSEQLQAMSDLRDALLSSPALRAIDYKSDAPVILAVDTSFIAVGYQLCQQDPANPRIRYYNRFGSITLNEREARFSQPKLELYGLYRALRALKFYLIGVRNLIVEVDARYIEGMLRNPDIAPSASMNRWIVSINTFHFELVHVPGERHGPDGLSRRPRQPGDTPEPEDDFDDWIDELYGFMHHINPPPALPNLDNRFEAVDEDAPLSVFVQLTSGTSARLPEVTPPDYSIVPRSPKARTLEERVARVRTWLESKSRPADVSDSEWKGLMKYAETFWLDKHNRLWRTSKQDTARLFVEPDSRPKVLVEYHDHIGHRGVYATRAHICERFWWPEIKADIAWYVRSCHLCQIRQTVRVHIPPTVPFPTPPMFRVHVDSMAMPGTYKYFFHARCATTSWSEGRASKKETAKTLGDWLWQDILCRWSIVGEIVSDNGSAFVAALEYIEKQYHIRHIRISGYNSQANGIVERPHFHIRDALYKACDGDAALYPSRVYSVLWADRTTVRRTLGCSPYFAVTGSHPVLPMDIAEATYLLPAPVSMISTSELIAQRAIALQKRAEHVAALRSRVFQARVDAARRFEEEHRATTKDFDFQPGRLVLIRNTAIEKSLNRKMRARYLGPVVIVSRNRGGAYIVAELDGSVFDRPIAAFRVIPYFARTETIPVPREALDIDSVRLRELENQEVADEDTEEFERPSDRTAEP